MREERERQAVASREGRANKHEKLGEKVCSFLWLNSENEVGGCTPSLRIHS